LKKIGLFTIAAACTAIFVGFNAGAANAAQGSFTFASSLTPIIQGGVDTYSGTINYTPTFGLSATTGTLLTSYSGGDYDVFLNGKEILTDGVLEESIKDYYVYVANGATFLAGTQPGATPGTFITTGSYTAPAPEASSMLGLGAMLIAGGLVLFAAKRRTSANVA
jgi:hypothetical protein